MNKILIDAREYLVEFLEGKQHRVESRHPWRKDWRFVVLHSHRVETYTTKILNREPHDLSDTEIILIRLGAILHDIGRLEMSENHAELGAQIVGDWLLNHRREWLTWEQVESVLEMISEHSNKENFESSYSAAVLKDADILDEIGVMSIFMSSNWIDHGSPFFFHDLRKRLIEFEIPFCNGKANLLNTNGAREILSEKKFFIENFITQITNELASDEQIVKLLLRSSRKDGEGHFEP
jgi:hypothetical protein